MKRFAILGLVLFGIGLVIISQIGDDEPQVTPQPPSSDDPIFPVSSVRYPTNFQSEFLHYATVDRIDGTVRDLYINPSAVDNIRGGRLPAGTTLVVVAYKAEKDASGDPITDSDGHFVRGEPFEMIHVLERRDNWRSSDFVSHLRNGDWNFGSFDAITGDPFNEDTASCFNCHNVAASSDFLYSVDELNRFLRTGTVQNAFCDLPNRLAC